MQTARWLFRPIEFLDACRRRHGDAFSVKFLGFQTPMVMISDPEAIRALYTSRENGLPPGRSFALEPIMGPRSVLLLEGARAPLAAQGDAAAVSRRAHARLRVGDRRGRRAPRSTRWPLGDAFPIHPRMQARDPRGDPAGGLRGHRPGAARAAARRCSARMLGEMASPRLQLQMLVARRFGRDDPIEQLRREAPAVDEMLHAEIAERRADPGARPSATTSSRCWSRPGSRTASR